MIEVENNGCFLVLQREEDGGIFLQPPDDAKVFRGHFPQQQGAHQCLKQDSMTACLLGTIA